MPIYEYVCECGAQLEVLDSVGARREYCEELCRLAACGTKGNAAPGLAFGKGRIARVLSAPGIRGDGHEAAEPTFDPVRRANRPGCDDCGSDG